MPRAGRPTMASTYLYFPGVTSAAICDQDAVSLSRIRASGPPRSRRKRKRRRWRHPPAAVAAASAEDKEETAPASAS